MKANRVVRIILVLLCVICLLLLLSYVNHKMKLKKEDALFVTNGTMVNVNGHNLNVYVSGNPESKYTLVFMSGAGTCSPTLDFKSLYSLYEADYQIAVVEKAGYGFSEISDADRDIDTMLAETREALEKAGVANKEYILFPHSMSGIEALYWANKYPDEIKGIVGLDPAVPESYANMKINNLNLSIVKFAADIGLTRWFPSIVDSSAAIQYGTLTEEEKELYRVIFYRRTQTDSMSNEIKAVKANAKKLEDIDETEVPLLFFVSNGEGTGFEEKDWHEFLTDYVSGKENATCVMLDCSHYVHDIEYQRIYEESLKFIQELD